MPFITFTSDFGIKDAYIAIVKAKILSFDASLTIIDISHEVEPCNLADAAFLVANAYSEFPKGSIHLIAVDSVGNKGDSFIAVSYNDHFFIGTNNGLISLITQEKNVKIVELPSLTISTFPAKDVFAENTAKLALGASLDDLGNKFTNYKRLIGRNLRTTKKEIIGTVIRVDYYGNLITNIKKSVFDKFLTIGKYTIKFGRQKTTSLNNQSNEVSPGNYYVYFNHLKLLEIGIRNGNASQLLGIKFDSPVWVKFDD